MTQNNPEQKKQIKKPLGLSAKKLSLNLHSKGIVSDNLVNKSQGKVIVVTKTKFSKINNSDNTDLTVANKQKMLTEFLNAEKTKVLNVNSHLVNVVKKLDKCQVNDLINAKTQSNENDKKAKVAIVLHDNEMRDKITSKVNNNASKAKVQERDIIENKTAIIKPEDVDKEFEHKKDIKNKKVINAKKELKKVPLTQVYNLEKEEDVIETRVTSIKINTKNSHKDLRLKKKRKVYREVKFSEQISVQTLAHRMTEKVSCVIRSLMKLGVTATINQVIDADTAELVIQELGHTPIRVSDSQIIESLLKEEHDSLASLLPRAPIVTVMGHVDHGKTSLLDALRSTDVISGEHGGITQHIGAYNVTLENNHSIVFVDTPGHAAFTAMRMRGAKITDIVVIVVAADDGIKEQTIEAINHAKAASVPIIVAINKIDKPFINIEKVKNSLFNHELIPEDKGGDTMVIPVSAKEKKGLKELEDAILLQAEVLSLKANPNRSAQGVVIESKLDKSKGVLATLLVQKGTLKIADIIIINNKYSKIRALVDDKGKKVNKAKPSTPIEVLGLSYAPEPGDSFIVVENEKIAKKLVEVKNYKEEKVANHSMTSFSELLKNQIDKEKMLNIIIKADFNGSLEAIKSCIQKLSNDEVKIKISHAVIGSITESDVSLAKVTNSIVLGFNVRADSKTTKMSNTLGVTIKYYSVIYDIIDDIKAMVGNLISPIQRELITGYAEIRQVITLSKIGKIAGCMVTEGIIKRKSSARLIRDNTVLYDNKLGSLKRFKDDIKEVKVGFECGISFDKFSDFKEKDKFEIYEIIEERNKIYD